MSDVDARPKLVIVGPVPPPAFGVAKATELMLGSSVLTSRLKITHLDTSDARGTANIGSFDWHNVYLGIKHPAQLVCLLVKERPDLVLLTASQGTLGLIRDGLFVLLGRAFDARVVTYLRGSRYADMRDTQGRLAARLLRSIFKASSRVLVLSEDLVGMAQKVYPDARVAVVPNGCPPAVRPGQVGQRDEKHPLLLYVGKLSRAKGVDDALLAARSIAASVPNLEFVLCGDWDPPAYQAEAMRLVEEGALTSVVRFPGSTTGQEKETLLARAWVLVVPSHSEGQPWVILEAMSAGLPVVATDTGAIAETVEDGVGGFVVAIGDSKVLAERVISLMRDRGLWKRTSEGALRQYQERFTVEHSHVALADELCRVARREAPTGGRLLP
jgi:glycosyltransferase involved in cell wall biosynthesis